MINKYLYSAIVTLFCVLSIVAQNDIQRVRVNLTTPTGYVRQLLLGFTPDNAATEGVDFGYDASSLDSFPNDFGWVIEDDSYIIQGVGEFSTDKFYPVGAFLSNSGAISIALHSLENFEDSIHVYIFDTLTNQYDRLNDEDCIKNMSSGDYYNRFYLTFRNDFPASMWQDLLSTEDLVADQINLHFSKVSNSISVNLNKSEIINSFSLYAINGQEIQTNNIANKNALEIQTNSLNKGVYLVNIVTNSSSITRKVLIY